MGANSHDYYVVQAREMTVNITETDIPAYIQNPVGQIVRLGDRGEIVHRFCSGFNVHGGQYFFTAGHCISAQEICIADDGVNLEKLLQYGAVNFGFKEKKITYDSKDNRLNDTYITEKGLVFKIENIEAHGHCEPANIDYGILKLSSGSEAFGSLNLDDTCPEIHTKIYTIHHPRGIPKRYSEGELISYSKDYGTFRHSAYTYAGSSGAPILVKHDHKVVGIHMAGDEDTQKIHEAVSTDTILNSIKINNHYHFFQYSNLSSSKEAVIEPIVPPAQGIYGFWQRNRPSILLGMSAAAVGLTVLTQTYQEENDSKSIGLQGVSSGGSV